MNDLFREITGLTPEIEKELFSSQKIEIILLNVLHKELPNIKVEKVNNIIHRFMKNIKEQAHRHTHL